MILNIFDLNIVRLIGPVVSTSGFSYLRNMRRPSQLPNELKDLRIMKPNRKYEIIEKGITYSMDLEHTRLIKRYWHVHQFGSKRPSVADWYKELRSEERKGISVTSSNF